MLRECKKHGLTEYKSENRGGHRCLKCRSESFGISQNGFTRTWDALLEEAKKCDLLCSNCHAETHDAGYANSR